MKYAIIFHNILHAILLAATVWLAGSNPVQGQQTASLAQRLGFPDSARLLIVHADDLGMAHSVNQASFEALASGAASSASIMIPCPWVSEAASFAKGFSKADIGLHLTLTSEWLYLKWGPVASRDTVASLADSLGYFYPDCATMAARAKPEEVERELRAQIEKALAMGIRPTHFDGHMGCLHGTNPALFDIYLKLGREYNVPVRLSKNLLESLPDSVRSAVQEQDIVIDHTYSATPEDFSNGLDKYYEQVLHNLKPGVNEIVIHLAYDGSEMRGVTYNHPDWGAVWRQADVNFFSSDQYRNILAQEGIRLIGWRDVGKLLK